MENAVDVGENHTDPWWTERLPTTGSQDRTNAQHGERLATHATSITCLDRTYSTQLSDMTQTCSKHVPICSPASPHFVLTSFDVFLPCSTLAPLHMAVMIGHFQICNSILLGCFKWSFMIVAKIIRRSLLLIM